MNHALRVMLLLSIDGMDMSCRHRKVITISCLLAVREFIGLLYSNACPMSCQTENSVLSLSLKNTQTHTLKYSSETA